MKIIITQNGLNMDKLKNLISQLKILLPQGIKMFMENNMTVFSGYATLFALLVILQIYDVLPEKHRTLKNIYIILTKHKHFDIIQLS